MWIYLMYLFHVIDMVRKCDKSVVMRVKSEYFFRSEGLATGTKITTLGC